MKARPISLALLLVLLAATGFRCTTRRVAVSKEVADRQASPYIWDDDARHDRMMIIGDLQPTHWIERLFLGRRQNDGVRRAMIDAVVDRRPSMFLMLGDMVADGARPEDWRQFDRLMAPINRAGIPIYALLGNHDYGMIDVKGIRECVERFPHAARLPGVVRLADSVVLVTVDSNLEALPSHRRRQQSDRYRSLLASLDRDPGITGVIVASHHPPMTNASLAIDPEIAATFVPPFLAAEKTLLFLSGHVHSYERFEWEGKTFVVTGGGGGPRRAVETGDGRNHTTDAYRHGSLRYHHYVDLSIRSEGIRAEVWMLVDGVFRLGDGFVVGSEN